jgi:hypothetical protein
VRGYAIAIGWRPHEALQRGGYRRVEPPELSYLVVDPRRERPTWVPEAVVVKHFRTFLSAERESLAPDEAAG